jgi:hypothetical protein
MFKLGLIPCFLTQNRKGSLFASTPALPALASTILDVAEDTRRLVVRGTAARYIARLELTTNGIGGFMIRV